MYRLPRKLKKKFKKDYFKKHGFIPEVNKCEFNWFYFRRKVEIKSMFSIINYPKIADKHEMIEWYTKNYTNNKENIHIINNL